MGDTNRIPLPPDVTRSLLALLAATAKSTHYAIGSVRLRAAADGMTMQASNGHILIEVRCDADLPHGAWLIPNTFLAKFQGQDAVKLFLCPDRIEADLGGITSFMEYQTGNWPDTGAVWPKPDAEDVQFSIALGVLHSLVETMRGLSGDEPILNLTLPRKIGRPCSVEVNDEQYIRACFMRAKP